MPGQSLGTRWVGAGHSEVMATKPPGSGMGVGIAIGVAFGMLAGILMNNVGLGLALGIALGAAAGGFMRASGRKSDK